MLPFGDANGYGMLPNGNGMGACMLPDGSVVGGLKCIVINKCIWVKYSMKGKWREKKVGGRCCGNR